MMAKNGSTAVVERWRARGIGWILACALAGIAPAQEEQDPALKEKLARLAENLAAQGPEGRATRDAAIQQLLTTPVVAAHEVLGRALARDDERETQKAILDALGQHLLGTATSLFGGAATDIKREIVVTYLGVLVRCWRPAADAGDPAAAAVRAAARTAVMRLPSLMESVRALLGAPAGADRPALFACLADLRQLQLAPMLADFVETEDVTVRDAARSALANLTFQDAPFTTRAQFDAWYAQNCTVPYVELAERKARAVARLVREEQVQVDNERLRRARDVVRAFADPQPGIKWAAIQKETIVDDAAAVDACIAVLQERLAGGLPAEDTAAPRLAFCRALLERWKQLPAEQSLRRAQLLQVAAYATRPDEGDLATEIQQNLVALLASEGPEALCGLRGLRRFPSVDGRTLIVRHAIGALSDRPLEVEAAVGTLLAKGTPRWCAPSPDDPDKADWIRLIREICTRPAYAKTMREPALVLAMLADAKDHLVPEVHAMLLELARDVRLDAAFRVTCIIRLQGWKYPEGVKPWLSTLLALLDDPEPQVRQNAALALGKFGDLDDTLRKDWLESTIKAIGVRLKDEPDRNVLESLGTTMQFCGSEPQMPARAIRAIILVLGEVAQSQLPDKQERTERLLAWLSTIAGDPDAAANGEWLGACGPLLAAQRRTSLLGLLDVQHAIDLAQYVKASESALVDRARDAMECVIRTALLKPAKESWQSTPELQAEALRVVRAFTALDGVPEDSRRLIPGQRLLRVEVEVAAKDYSGAVAHAKAWLALKSGATPNPAPEAAPLAPETADAMRVVAAEAYLELKKPEEAARLLAELDPARPVDDRTKVVFCRVAKEPKIEPKTAVDFLDKARRATTVEDKAFRQRLIDWALAQRNLDPSSVAQVWAEVAPHTPLFEAADCPSELAAAFQRLRNER